MIQANRSLILALSTLLLASFSYASSEETFKAKVLRISDGDTVVVTTNDTDKIKIRMMGEDTAETHLPVPGGMASQGYWGEQGAQEITRLIPPGTEVEVVSFGLDRYGRTLARLYHKGIDVNLEMVRSGWGVMYVICGKGECRKGQWEQDNHLAEYRAACQNAVKQGLGLFNPDKPVPELPFEFRLRMQQRTPDKFVADVESKRLYAPEDYKKVDVCNRVFFYDRADALSMGFGH